MLPIRTEYLAFGRPNFSEDEIAAVVRVMRSGWIGQGNETHAFEQELSAYTGAADVITVNSCTSALFLALLVAGTRPGDEVIVPSFTWCSTANAALYAGATPVLCDIDPVTLNVTAQTIAPLVTAKTRAVIVVHMAGLTVDVGALRRALPAHIAIIEDAAHALGSRFADGTHVGATGNLTCFSFYANKNVATAEGGAIAVTDGEQAARLRSLRLHALPADAWKRFTNPNVVISAEIEELGYKMNYTDLQAAIGRVQLARQPALQELRLQVAKVYSERLAGSGILSMQQGILSPSHARHLFVVMLDADRLAKRGLTRDAVLRALRSRNVGASIHYHPLHRMRLYARPGAQLPATDDIAPRVLTLPISASMSSADAHYVADHLQDIIK